MLVILTLEPARRWDGPSQLKGTGTDALRSMCSACPFTSEDAVGHDLLDRYLVFVAAQCRRITVLATVVSCARITASTLSC
ncbi:MAG: hypothetical protein NVS3B18_06150 [Candidatus Dormibacteria bacterium]